MNLEGKLTLFDNVNISNIKSNGNVIYMEGDIINVEWNHGYVNNSISNGPFLKTKSNNIDIQFKSFIFKNNENGSKNDYGFISMANNININIDYSEFMNNESYSSGIFFFNDTKNNNIYINNSIFTSNICHSKGTILYLNEDTSNEYKYQKSISIIESNFEYNKAGYFGGVAFINNRIEFQYNLDIRKNKFFNNSVGVAGGVFFFEQPNDRIYYIHNLLKMKSNENEFKNNKANSHGPDFATHPTQFEIENSNNIGGLTNNEIKNGIEIYSGETTSFSIILKDKLNNIVEDLEKFYSDIGITIELYDYDRNEKVPNYSIVTSENIFNRGNCLSYI
ncbi:hypothetical protein BCR36DRAFT_346093 [Piromyces finnis]|uniref:Right handed beta helix domain-containing protein n=1 Tax=Piromyces finnis TaxID=1754191 RepID=A0A1Y1VI32_9FUNG|nr:hypothetical protein BCR36DRAFT_346093 [Piromyces finnis]|eukprot:ORX56692.1 hypothetical protein BCR36DRAFT_346093 [Piromyces finnis]